MKKIVISLFCLIHTLAPWMVHCAPRDSSVAAALMQEPDLHIEIHNRILTKILDTPITLNDVMKKMDVNFFQQFPEYAKSKQARFQFYQAHWKNTFFDLIEKELILHDAEVSKIPLPTSELRQEIEQTFGPNVMANLEKIGITYDEAAKNIEEDILLRRMLMYRSQIKAVRAVTPKMLREYYQNKKEEFTQSAEWSYRVISIRDKEEQKAREIAQKVLQVAKTTPIDELEVALNGKPYEASAKIAELVTQQEKALSPSYKEVLLNLEPGQYSPLIEQLDRKNHPFFRIFYLQAYKPLTIQPFNEVAGKIKNRLINEQVDIETNKYLEGLKKKFGINQETIFSSLPANFEPFTLHEIK